MTCTAANVKRETFRKTIAQDQFKKNDKCGSFEAKYEEVRGGSGQKYL